MADSLRIIVLLGTARTGRQSEKVAAVVRACAEGHGFAVDFVDVKDHLQSFTEEREIKAWSQKVLAADGLIIVSPEYNHGYPGELKLLLDSAYAEYNHKPLGIVGVSDGPAGGIRMAEQLRLVAVTLGLVPIRAIVHFAMVKELFDQSGALKDKEAWEKKLEVLCQEMEWYARALKAAR